MKVLDRGEVVLRESIQVNFPLISKAYNLLTEIAAGTEAVVYKARCIPLNSQLVAIKTIDLDRRLLFFSLRDLTVGAQTLTTSYPSHPNVVSPLCSFLAEDQRYWIVMPFFPRGSLLSIMYDNKVGYAVSFISVLLREVLKGLAYLHSLGNSHGDIKLGNILFGNDGSIKLADYGISETFYDPDSGRFRPKTNTNAKNDVPYWIAPENWYTPKSDIWAVGILALEMSYGRPPLSEVPDTEPMLWRIRKRFGSWMTEKTRVYNLWPISKEFKDMVSLCLEQDPNKRPSTQDLLNHPFITREHYLESDVIVNFLLHKLPGVENRPPCKEKDDKIPDHLLDTGQPWWNPRRFVTSWKFNRETLLMDPEFVTESSIEFPVSGIDEQNLSLIEKWENWNRLIGEKDKITAIMESIRDTNKVRSEEEMAKEIEVLKNDLEVEKKRNSDLESSLETLRAQVAQLILAARTSTS